MARTLYGGAAADVVVTAQVIGQYTVPVLAPGTSLTAWTARTGGSQITDLQTVAGGAVSVVTADAAGRVLIFGPDGYTADLWLQDPVTGSRYRLPGTSGGGGGSAGIPESTLTTKGDLVVRTSSAITRLGVGSNGQVLTADSAVTAGVKWATPAAGGGGSAVLPNTKVVAASGSGITGDYNCDGTADNVEIQAAINAVGRNGRVLLTAGTFNLAATVLLEGSDDADVEGEIYLQGAGPSNTTLAVGAGVTAGLDLRKAVRCHISDLGLTVTGASDGITATHSTTPAAVYRSAWFSSIERVQVKGPWNGTHTGWGLDLDNVFRFRCANVEVGGTGNGIRMANLTAEFNAGDATFDRCFVEIVGNNGTAYACTSTAGNMNQILWQTCHSIADPANTGTVAWRFDGAGNTSHMRLANCNVEQFATSLLVGPSAYDIDVDFVHVTVRNGATLADLDGYDCRVRTGLIYVPASATITAVDDDNGYSRKPNIIGPMSIYADTGTTVNADVDSFAVVRDIVYDGPGTVAAVLKVGPGVTTQSPAIGLTDAATVATDASLGSVFSVALTANRTIGAPTNPTPGQEATWRLIASGGARTPTFATGAGGFVIATGTPAVTVSAIASGSTAEVVAVYNATDNRWRIKSYQMFTAT